MESPIRDGAIHQATILRRVWRWISKAYWKWILGQSELQRLAIQSSEMDQTTQMARFRACLALSDHLKAASDTIFRIQSFNVEEISKRLAELEGIDVHDIRMMQILRGWLHRCNFANHVCLKLFEQQNEGYSSANERHESMLEELWASLKPQMRREHGRITKEWGEIGFQGTDPMTDFRGMGILSLYQLIYFAKTYPIEARRILAESNHITHWFPFSVTGINITAYIIEMAEKRVCDIKIYPRAALAEDEYPRALQNGVDSIHELYCDIFVCFSQMWSDSNPQSPMDFPAIFEGTKKKMNRALEKRSFQLY